MMIPTYHYHGHTDTILADWDHYIYTNGTIDRLDENRAAGYCDDEFRRSDRGAGNRFCGLDRAKLGPYDRLFFFDNECRCYRVGAGFGHNVDLVARV
jgi:hypothetical protein